MGLTLAERRAVTATTAIRYSLADKRAKGIILDELCATTGWHRSHARKALATALQPKVVAPRSPRPPTYGPDVIAALTVCWTVLGMPAGKRLAPVLNELVAVLRQFGELVIDEDTAAFIGPDEVVEIEGSGSVTLVDPSEVSFSSIGTVEDGQPACMLGLRLHLLVPGATFNLKTRVASASALTQTKE